MKLREINYSINVKDSIIYILSRTLLYAVLWFGLWTLVDYFRTSEDFHLKISLNYLGFYLFVGWLIALLDWKSNENKRNPAK
ncbi:MAG TPA: hypothetical protein VE732_07385 [Nitrososphaera sp.]|jgi:hypothetical protein|nr:hypothetical protein [Nitrososphaera sp.]